MTALVPSFVYIYIHAGLENTTPAVDSFCPRGVFHFTSTCLPRVSTGRIAGLRLKWWHLFFDIYILVLRDWETSTIPKLASSPKGTTCESTTNSAEKPVGKTGLGVVLSSGNCPQASGKAPFPTKISGKHVQELEPTSKAELGRLVTTMAQESQQASQEEGGHRKGATRRRCAATLRCYAWWFVLIVFYNSGQCGAAGDAVLQGVCQLREGEQLPAAREPEEDASRREQGKPERAAEKAQQAKKPPQQDPEQAEGTGQGQRTMGLMADFGQRGGPKAEVQARRESETLDQGAGGPTGRREAIEPGRRGGNGDGGRTGPRGFPGGPDARERGRGSEFKVEDDAETDGRNVSASIGGRSQKDAATFLGTVPAVSSGQHGPLSCDRGWGRRKCDEQGRDQGDEWSIEDPTRSGKESNCAIWSSTPRQNGSCELPIWAQGEDRGTTERRKDDDECLHGKSGYRSRAVNPGVPHFHVDDADGAVEHSRICQSGIWSSEEIGQILWILVCSERFWFFIFCVATDLLVFAAVILWIVTRSDAKGKHAVKVANHRFFFRRRMTEKKCSRSGVFMIVLICQQHMIQGSMMVGSNWNEASSLTSTTTQFPSDASGTEDLHDLSDLMTRPERAWDHGAMPLPGPRRTHQRSRERSEGGDFSNGQESDGDYYQMAFIFQLGLPPISRRLFWDDYWPMHRQIANACGVSIDELVGVHHIKHQPTDLDELDVQSVIAQKDHEAFHGEGIVLTLADIEQHSADVGDPIRTVREIRRISKFTTRQGILRALGVESHCQIDPHPCIVWKNNRLWEQQSLLVKEIFHGDYIRCSIPPEVEDTCEEEDVSSMMQRNAATQTVRLDDDVSERIEIEVYGLGQDYILLEEIEDNPRSVIEGLEYTWDISEDEIAAVHEVNDPPIHRQRRHLAIYILELRTDNQAKGRPDDVMVLSEIIVRGNPVNGDRTSKMTVQWMRRKARRIQVLSQLRLDGLCDGDEVHDCRVYYNNILWDESDYALRHFGNGDSIWVIVQMETGSAMSAIVCLENFESSERSRRIYGGRPGQHGRTPSLEGDLSTPDAAGHRSRSRSRGHLVRGGDSEALGSVEDATWDLDRHPEDRCEGLSLLQIKGAISKADQRHGVTMSFSRLPPPGNTHSDSSGEEKKVEFYEISDNEEIQEGHGETTCSMHTDIGKGDLWKLFQPWNEDVLELGLDIDDSFTAVSLQFLSKCVVGWDDDIAEVHIYTDGSFHRGYEVASFALAIFGWNGDVDYKHYFAGWSGGLVELSQDNRQFVGASRQSAGEGEVSGLLWALMWVLQSRHWKPIHLHFDSTSAGFTATGDWNFEQGSLQKRKLRELAQAVEAMRPGMVHYHHVRAHSCHPCNDLVDGFAKQIIAKGVRSRGQLPDWRPIFEKDSQALSWAWWFLRGLQQGSGLPKLGSEGYQWNKELVCGLGDIRPMEQQVKWNNEEVIYYLKVATYNVMTLRDKETEQGQRGEDWKAASLRSQFDEGGYHVIGLQETRAQESSVISTPDYVRFVSGGQDGHHGCELWVHRQRKIGDRGESPVTINPNKCTVLHADPRALIVSMNIDGCSLVFFVLHAPHDGTEEDIRQQWWAKIQGLLQRFKNVGHTVILADLNARFGDETPGRVGSLTCSRTTKNGESFLEMMEEMDGWLPSTFPDFHTGEDWTWTHPRGTRARLDYVAVERSDRLRVRSSWVDRDIQTSLTVRDHEVVGLDFDLHCYRWAHPKKRASYDWDALLTVEGRAKFQALVRELPDPDWLTDVHSHWQQLEDGLHNGLAKHFGAQQRKPRKAMFSDRTLKSLDQRKQAKRIMDQCDAELDGLDLRSSFGAWKDRMKLTTTNEIERLRRYAVILCHLQGLHSFRMAAKQVRSGIKDDKARFIEGVADKAESAKGVDVYKELRPLRIGGKFRKRGPTTLPGFILDGEQAVDHLHNESLWLRHCANLEAGVQTSTARLLQRARKGAMERMSRLETPFKLENAPTLTLLEGAFRHVKRSKAGGTDGFTSDICVAAPKELASKFFPVMVKMLAMVEEPIQMKGGILVHAFKGGSHTNPEDHRSLLLSSHLGKAIRRVLRQQIIVPYAASAPETFFSIRAGGNVSLASQALRLYCGGASAQGDSIGILFLDVKAAYYRVIRQLVVGSGGPTSLERVMQHFDLGATDLQELLEEAHGVPEGKLSNLTQHQELMLEELLSSTWFTAQHRSTGYESLAGSRPGDGLADVVFGFIFKRILRRATIKLEELLQLEEVQIDGEIDLTSAPTTGRDIPRLLQAVWAGDLAVCYRRRGALGLAEEMALITSVIFGECIRHGLLPNLKKGKSEIILFFKGEGSRQAKAQYFNKEDPKLYIPNVPEDFQWVCLVHTYRHLGSRVHISLKLLPEIKARCGQAWQVYRKHRKQIFQNSRISLRKRLFLFGSMVMSILEYNVGTWGRLSAGEWTYFRKRLMSLYRGLTRATVPEEQLRLWSHDRVLAFLRMPSPECVVHAARLRYMMSLWRSAPSTLLHLVGAEGKWLAELQESQLWMAEELRGYGPDAHGHPWTPAWEQWKQTGGGGMKGWIRKAKTCAILRHARKIGWREFHFDFINEIIDLGWQHDFPWPAGSDFAEGKELDACLACGLVFKSRTAWSVHAFRTHQRQAPERLVIGGTRCDACEREYRSTARLLMHLRNSGRCYRRLIQARKVYPQALPGIGNRNEHRDGPMPIRSSQVPGHVRRHFYKRPPRRSQIMMMSSLRRCWIAFWR